MVIEREKFNIVNNHNAKKQNIYLSIQGDENFVLQNWWELHIRSQCYFHHYFYSTIL